MNGYGLSRMPFGHMRLWLCTRRDEQGVHRPWKGEPYIIVRAENETMAIHFARQECIRERKVDFINDLRAFEIQVENEPGLVLSIFA
jgi:hypothetical protein